MIGGATFELFVQHEAAAIEHGDADVVLITCGSDLLSRADRALGGTGVRQGRCRSGPSAQYEAPYGNMLIGSCALAAQRHMYEYGTTSEQLASVAVSARRFAAWNPSAMYRDPLTVNEVLSSRLAADQHEGQRRRCGTRRSHHRDGGRGGLRRSR
jgi:acetyl-CoA acetyltransferase